MTDQNFLERRGKKYPLYVREAYRAIQREKDGLTADAILAWLRKENVAGIPQTAEALVTALDAVPTLFQAENRWYTVPQFIVKSRSMPQDEARALLKKIMAKQLAHREPDDGKKAA